MQNIRIARLTGIYFTDSKRPVVNKIDPEVKNKKSLICILYILTVGLFIKIAGVINIEAIIYLRIMARPTPAPKLYAILVNL